MNIYPTGSALHEAFAHVALESDRVWWNEKDYGDVYKMANLNLYKNLLKASKLQKNNEDIGLMMNRLDGDKPSTSTDKTEQFFNWSFDECANNQNTKSANNVMEQYPALIEWLKSQDTSESNSNVCLPYSIETLDDLILYNCVHQTSIKKLWSHEKSMQELEASPKNESTDLLDEFQPAVTNLGLHYSDLNANVPEFYPSVLLPPVQTPPRFPSVYDADYQAELFPFKEDSKWSEHQHSGNLLLNYSSEYDWIPRMQDTQNQNQMLPPSSSSKSYPISVTKSYNLAPADFPELPKAQDSSTDIILKTNIWLETAFPKRCQEFNQIAEVVARFDSIMRKLTDAQQDVICSSSKQDRRLYRDVLAHKECDLKEDGGLEVKFEELEREALAQYRASQTSLVPVTELSPELEQNLEREALEQYSGEFNSEAVSDSREQPDAPYLGGNGRLLQSNDETISLVAETGEPSIHNSEKHDGEEQCMTNIQKKSGTNEPVQTPSKKHSPQQSPNHQNKNKNRQRKGNKKRRRRWKGSCGGGGASCNSGESLRECRNEKCGETVRNQASIYSKTSVTSTNKMRVNCANDNEMELKQLCSALKHRALNYLKGVELNLTDDIKRNNNKNTIKQLLYKGPPPAPIVQSVKLEDIEDAETYKQYSKEVTTAARTLLLTMYKRIRTELMDTTTAGKIVIVAPTTAEKRKVRHKIQKCVQLLERAEQLKRVPRKPIEPARREVAATLKLLHRTMEVVYALKDMSRMAHEDAQYLITNKAILLDICRGSAFIQDKSEFIQKKILDGERNLLLLLLFPRRAGVLMDRISERLSSNQEGNNVSYIDWNSVITSFELISRFHRPNSIVHAFCNDRIRIMNVFRYDSHKKRDLWNADNWEHFLNIGNRFYCRVELVFYGDVDYVYYVEDELKFVDGPIYDHDSNNTDTAADSAHYAHTTQHQHNEHSAVDSIMKSCLLNDYYCSAARSSISSFISNILVNDKETTGGALSVPASFLGDQLLQTVKRVEHDGRDAILVVQKDDIDDDDEAGNVDDVANEAGDDLEQSGGHHHKGGNMQKVQRKPTRMITDSTCCLQ